MPRTIVATRSLSARTSARRHGGPLVVAVGAHDVVPVLRAARTVASRFGNRIDVISVLEPLSALQLDGVPIVVAPHLDEDRRSALLELITTESRGIAAPDEEWTQEVLPGDPASTLAERARALDAPLIVMGIGRHQPLDRLLASETTLRTIRHAGCPVLAVGASLESLPRVVVVGTDFSARSAFAAESVFPLLAEGASLHLVHVWEPTKAADLGTLAVEWKYEESLPARFQRFASSLTPPDGVTITHEVREGRTARQILDCAQERRADLVVAGRQGLNVFARFVVGSVSSAIVRGASCSVLVTPEPTFMDLDRLQRLLTGTSRSRNAGEWAEQLAAFTRRNQARRASLEVDDPAIGAQAQETGYSLLGASYDPHDRRVQLMLGGSGGGTQHLTRGIGGVDEVAVLSDAKGIDLGLCIRHGAGQTLLTFSDPG